MILILISGKAGVGKTTFATMLAREAFNRGLCPVMASFAGALKKEAEEKGYKKSMDPEGYRKFCQENGEKMRKEDPLYWIKLFDEELDSYRVKEQDLLKKNEKFWEHCVIVDDCRYQNELDYGKTLNATSIFLLFGERDNPNEQRKWLAHESEALANSVEESPRHYDSEFDYLIYNDSTIEDLEDKVNAGMSYWCNMMADEDSGKKLKEISRAVEDMLDFIIFDDLNEDAEYKEGSD